MIEDDYIPARCEGAERWCVIISGCSGGGKSSLINELARHGYRVFPEPGREIVKEQLHIGGEGLPWQPDFRLFCELCASRIMNHYNGLGKVDRPVFFDRSLIDPVVGYMRHNLQPPAHFVKAAELYRFHRRVFLTPPWPEIHKTDAERRHGFDEAVAEYEQALKTYPLY
ncbi:MAG: AAA family ATPase, partial [Alphaproteobacteria bacterium]